MSGCTKISFGVFNTKDGIMIREVRSVKNEDYTLTYLSKEDIDHITIGCHPVEEGKYSIQLTPTSIIVVDIETMHDLVLHLFRRWAEIKENGL